MSAEGIQAIPSFRGNFVQGSEGCLFLVITEFDGTPFDPESISVVVSADDDGEIIVSNGCADKVTTGSYVFEWDIPEDLDPGKYIVSWVYEANGEICTEDQVIVVAEACDEGARLFTGRTLLIRQSLELMIACAQAIPVYFQQAQPTRDMQTFRWTKGLWNMHPMTRIYRNKEIISSGAKINYFKGEVTFDEPLTEHDIVHADYNFRWFTDQELDRFISNGLHAFNSFAPHTFHTVNNIPDKDLVTVLYGAAKDALRHLMMCLQFEEPIQFFGGPDEASKRFGQMETLKKNYEGDWLKLLEQKKYRPYVGLTRSVVAPEFTLPGGRSRWFRHLFKSGASGG